MPSYSVRRGAHLPLQTVLDKGLLEIVCLSREHVRANQLRAILVDRIRANKTRRLSLDSASYLLHEGLAPLEARQVLRGLIASFKTLGVTSCFTAELGAPSSPSKGCRRSSTTSSCSAPAEIAGGLKPTLTVVKTRSSRHDFGTHDVTFAAGVFRSARRQEQHRAAARRKMVVVRRASARRSGNGERGELFTEVGAVRGTGLAAVERSRESVPKSRVAVTVRASTPVRGASSRTPRARTDLSSSPRPPRDREAPHRFEASESSISAVLSIMTKALASDGATILYEVSGHLRHGVEPPGDDTLPSGPRRGAPPGGVPLPHGRARQCARERRRLRTATAPGPRRNSWRPSLRRHPSSDSSSSRSW